MAELRSIERVVGLVRRRLRWQAAVDTATTAAIPGVAGALVVFWLARMELIAPRHAILAALGLGAGVLVAAVISATRRLPVARVASRIDRASDLSDRLGTAVDFQARLAREHDLHPETAALMRHAVLDGVAAAARANIKASAPWHTPRDLRALAAFVGVGAAVVALAFGPERDGPPARLVAAVVPTTGLKPDADTIDPEDIDVQRDVVEDMKELAEQTGDEDLRDLAQKIDALLEQAAKGQIGKRELLAKMDELERQASAGKQRDLDAVLKDLKDQSKELARQPVTKKLAEALDKGDLEQAAKELESLADKVEKNELKPEEKEKLADALEKAAAKQEQKEQQREKEQQAEQTATEKKIEEQKEKIRTLEKKAAAQPQDEEPRRTLVKEKRELERLEREKQEQAERPKRQLERLTRSLKQSAEDLRKKKQEEQEQAKQQAARNLRDGAKEQQRIQQQMRKMANQQKVKSQLDDLKDAIRRAKPQRGGNGGERQARQQRMKDWQQRAGGGKSNAQAWKPGQGNQPGAESNGKEGQLGEKGQKPGGPQPGDQHDPNLSGDPTKLDAKLRDEKLTGVHGEGPSRRETILTSAKKGFAQTSYKKVYTDYKKVVEEVLTQEKVPQGYKYYVKRYFQRIKPHSMD